MPMIAASLAAVLTMLGSVPQDPVRQPSVSSTDDPVTELEEVVVNGRTLSGAVDSFVNTVTASPRGAGPARWDRKVCVGVLNLKASTAQVMIDRVSDVALEIGLEIGEPGCSPNILVIATDNGSSLATALVEARPLAFRPPYAGAARSAAALDSFRTTDRPVRWWHVSLPTDEDTGAVAVRIPGYDAPMVNTLGGRLRTEVVNDLRRAFIIVDIPRSSDVTFQQLSDYVAMVAFAQIDPEADIAGFPTILNAFDDTDAAVGLTDWDMSYLKSLYGAVLNQRNAGSQRDAVGGIMLRDRRRAEQDALSDAAE